MDAQRSYRNTDGRPLAVVTGASSGLGYALAQEFARRGFDLLVAADDEGIYPAAHGLADLGAGVQPLRVDLASHAGVEQLYQEIRLAGRPVDVVAINAGVGGHGGLARGDDLHAELNLIGLTVTAAVHLAKRVLPGMVDRGRGRLLFTSSVAAITPGPFAATYAASKAFLHSFAAAIRAELDGTGVTVTALLPGPTDPTFVDRAVTALLAGRDHRVAGSIRTKAQLALGRLMPERAKAAVHRTLSAAGAAK